MACQLCHLPGTCLRWLPSPAHECHAACDGVARAVPLHAPSSWGCWVPSTLARVLERPLQPRRRTAGPQVPAMPPQGPQCPSTLPLCPEQAGELGAACLRGAGQATPKSSCQPPCKPCQPSCKSHCKPCGNTPSAKNMLQLKAEHPSALQPPCAAKPPASLHPIHGPDAARGTTQGMAAWVSSGDRPLSVSKPVKNHCCSV